MCGHMQEGALGSADALLRAYDARTDAAIGKYVATLPQVMHEEITNIFMHGQAQAGVVWNRCRDGIVDGAGPGANPDDDDDDARHHGSSRAGLVADTGAEDIEHPQSQRRQGTGPNIQRSLTRAADKCEGAGLMDWFGNAGSSHDMGWLEDLAHPDTDHTWLWALTPAQGRALEDCGFVEAVRLRLGVGGPDTATCGLYGNAVLEPSGAHPARCATSEATRGHNRVRNIVYEFSLFADASAECGPPGLVPELPMLRFADILISAALDGCTAALDVGITASGASEADADPAEIMHNKKARERLPIQATLAAQSIRYVPIVWTSYGRPHEAAKAALQHIARQVARRRGDGCAQAVQRQMRRAIGTELARRAARMSFACRPTKSPQAGVSDSDSDVD